MERLDWLCETLKEFKDKTSNKKRKNDKPFKDNVIKKTKFEISRDENGGKYYPFYFFNRNDLSNTNESILKTP